MRRSIFQGSFLVDRFNLAALLPVLALSPTVASASTEAASEPIRVTLTADDDVVSLATQAGAHWQLMPSDFPGPMADETGMLAAERDISVPRDLPLQGVSVMASPNRSRWYRLIFEVAHLSEQSIALRLGEISDRDRTYLNGTLIGQTGTWDVARPQAYDRVRIYEILPGQLRLGRNVLHIAVQAYFDDEYGIYRDRIEIGSAETIRTDYYLDTTFDLLILAVYATFGCYFLLFYAWRPQDQENLFFGLCLISIVLSSLSASQLKYILGYELYWTKRVQNLTLMVGFPLFYFFIRTYYPLPANIARIWDRLAYIMHLMPVIGITVVLYSESPQTWQQTVYSLIQPGWLLYSGAILFIVLRAARQGNNDAHMMLGGMALLGITMVMEVLSSRAIINAPRLWLYAFLLFVISMAVVLANRFVRLHTHTEVLNHQLARLNRASRRFVPLKLLTLLERRSIADVALGDQVQKEMTVLFADIRSFTALSETMTPKQNFAFINQYLRHMGPIIRKHHGFIDKYIGDAIMALFPDSADDAFDAAVAMHDSLRIWNQERRDSGLPIVEIGIGIHRGRLMLGTIGENERMEGTVISDAVNLSARIEGLTRMYGAGILTSDATCGALKQPERFYVRRLDRVRVKGKQQAIGLYEVLNILSNEAQHRREHVAADFQHALDLYLAGQFPAAEQAFAVVSRQDDGDRAAQLYIDRCQRLQRMDAERDWDGATILNSK